MMKNKFKVLLVSLPWFDFQAPSLTIGHLAAYANMHGFNVAARHSHLEAAAFFDLSDYASIATHEGAGEAIAAALLIPERKKAIEAFLKGKIRNTELLMPALHSALLHVFKGIRWSNFNLIGFSSSQQQLFSALLISSWIKRDNPHVRILIGGRPVAGKMGESVMRRFSQVDWCVDGEGEVPFISLLDQLSRGMKSFETSVPGLIYRTHKGIRRNQRAHVTSLKRFPDPDYQHYFTLLKSSKPLREKRVSSYIPLEISRGCRFKCAFCSEHSFFGPLRHRPALELKRQIERLTSRFNSVSVLLSGLMVDKADGLKIFRKIASSRRDYKIHCQFRADLNRETLETMKSAGVCHVSIGLESLDSGLLRKMKKGTRFIDNLQSMKLCEELGIVRKSNLILNFPTESKEDVYANEKASYFAMPYRPANIVSFALFDESPAQLKPASFDIAHIDDAGSLGNLLGGKFREMSFFYKTFKLKRPKITHSRLLKQIEIWYERYNEAMAIGRPLLYYLDFGDFLRIEDYRQRRTSTVIQGWKRDLYLFCDSIRSENQIFSRFNSKCKRAIGNALYELVNKKLIYGEDGDYLSLAIRSAPANRRFMSFL